MGHDVDVDDQARLDAEARRCIARGLTYSVLAGLAVVAGAAAIAWMSGGPNRYVLVALGVAVGGAMATQVHRRCNRAGMAAATATAVMTAVAIPAVVVGDLAADHGMGYFETVGHVASLPALYAEFFAHGMWRAVAAVSVALIAAFVLGKGLGAKQA